MYYLPWGICLGSDGWLVEYLKCILPLVRAPAFWASESDRGRVESLVRTCPRQQVPEHRVGQSPF